MCELGFKLGRKKLLLFFVKKKILNDEKKEYESFFPRTVVVFVLAGRSSEDPRLRRETPLMPGGGGIIEFYSSDYFELDTRLLEGFSPKKKRRDNFLSSKTLRFFSSTMKGTLSREVDFILFFFNPY